MPDPKEGVLDFLQSFLEAGARRLDFDLGPFILREGGSTTPLK